MNAFLRTNTLKDAARQAIKIHIVKLDPLDVLTNISLACKSLKRS